MSRSDLERLSKEELIELVLRLQRPEKTSRTSSKPPSTDRLPRHVGRSRRGCRAHRRRYRPPGTPGHRLRHHPRYRQRLKPTLLKEWVIALGLRRSSMRPNGLT